MVPACTLHAPSPLRSPCPLRGVDWARSSGCLAGLLWVSSFSPAEHSASSRAGPWVRAHRGLLGAWLLCSSQPLWGSQPLRKYSSRDFLEGSLRLPSLEKSQFKILLLAVSVLCIFPSQRHQMPAFYQLCWGWVSRWWRVPEVCAGAWGELLLCRGAEAGWALSPLLHNKGCRLCASASCVFMHMLCCLNLPSQIFSLPE